jgi:hypothetical protein
MAQGVIQISGPVKSRAYPKTASTALTANSLVTLTSGKLVAAGAATTSFAGVIPRAVVAADDDYASASEVPVITLHDGATFLMGTSGASAATHVGNDYDLSDAVTVNLSASAVKVVTVVRVLSATLIEVKFNRAIISEA